MRENINIPNELHEVIDRLNSKGYSAYFVGGCVRDSLLGRPVYDYDVTTSALPETVAELFCDCKVIPTGIKHGTVTVIYAGFPVEVTTFRKDGVYLDNRHPKSVEFSDNVEDDTKRRDFTINALCYNLNDGLLDYHGGINDLQKGIVKCVGDPNLRFKEDALRILRGLRFAAKLKFAIDDETAKAMICNCGLIANVSVERVLTELKGFFETEDPYAYVKEFFAVFKALFNVATFSKFETLERALASVDTKHKTAVFFAVLGGSVEGAEGLARKFKPDKETFIAVSALAEAIYTDCFKTALDLANTVKKHGLSRAEVMYRLSIALDKSVCMGAKKRIELIKNGVLPISFTELAVNGNDVASLGAVGKDIGCVLEHLFDSVHNGVDNDRIVLLAEAKRFIDERKN